MALDASIYDRFMQPKSVADYDLQAASVQQAQQSNALNKLKLQQGMRADQDAQRALQEQNEARNALVGLGGGATDEQRVNALRSLGTQTGYQMADSLDTSVQNRAKSAASAAKDTADVNAKKLDSTRKMFEYGIQSLQTADSPQMATALINQGVAQGHWGMQQAQQMLGSLQRAGNYQDWRSQQLAAITAAKDQLPTIQTRNTGGTTDTLAVNVFSGKPMLTSSIQNTASPGELLAAETQRRGQNLTDARSRDANQTTLTKPFEVTGPDGTPMLVQQDKQGNISPVKGYGPKAGSAKPLTDSQAKALGFGSRMQEADQLLGDLESKGVNTPSLIKQSVESLPLVGAALGTLANATVASPDQQSVEQAQRDFVNAVLRRESGAAISEGEFANARKQYFPQPGDSAQVKQQKARNRALATQGVLAEVPTGQRTSLTGAPAQMPGQPLAPALPAGWKIEKVQ